MRVVGRRVPPPPLIFDVHGVLRSLNLPWCKPWEYRSHGPVVGSTSRRTALGRQLLDTPVRPDGYHMKE